MTTETELTPILEILWRFLERGADFVSRAELTRDALQTWNSSMRAQLAKIYGKDSPQLSYFPSVSLSLNKQQALDELKKRLAHLQRLLKALDVLPQTTQPPLSGDKVFIGHGRSPLWRELKDFLNDRLGLLWDEFNREATAGYTTTDRLQVMLSQAAFAFLIMTAEEERTDATLHARPNVIHEVGLFQGHLGLRRAVILLEDGCTEFSNIIGLSQIRFPRGDIAARFEEVRRVLERERLI